MKRSTGTALVILLMTRPFVLSLGSPITAWPGDTIKIFTISNIFNITDALIECKRPDLEPNIIILFYRENRTYLDDIDSSYRDRVRPPSSENGVVTVELTNVTRNDSGLYECTLTSKVSGDFTQNTTVQVIDPEEDTNDQTREVKGGVGRAENQKKIVDKNVKEVEGIAKKGDGDSKKDRVKEKGNSIFVHLIWL